MRIRPTQGPKSCADIDDSERLFQRMLAILFVWLVNDKTIFRLLCSFFNKVLGSQDEDLVGTVVATGVRDRTSATIYQSNWLQLAPHITAVIYDVLITWTRAKFRWILGSLTTVVSRNSVQWPTQGPQTRISIISVSLPDDRLSSSMLNDVEDREACPTPHCDFHGTCGT